VNEQNSEDDASHTAVVHLYLGALEFLEGNRDDALRHAHTAQTIWPEYPRPLITKGTIFYSLANEQHSQFQDGEYRTPTDAVSLDEDLSCAEVDTILSLSIEDNLELARRCYEEALEINRQSDTILVSTMDIEAKVMLSLGSIALTLADIEQEPDGWMQAQEAFQRVIDIYTSPDTSDSKQERLQRLAAHAYARRGLILYCKPDCHNPAPKSLAELESARSYYEQALNLLQTTDACRANIEDCLPRDQNSIQEYQNMLNTLEEILNSRNLEQSSSTLTFTPNNETSVNTWLTVGATQ
jgi:tetratricopeptide (TPR) repeat protein